MTTELIERLQACADDPMWADHAEVSKGLLRKAIEALNQQAAPPKLTLALPIFEKRRIVIVSDEMIDGERLVCVAIDDKRNE